MFLEEKTRGEERRRGEEITRGGDSFFLPLFNQDSPIEIQISYARESWPHAHHVGDSPGLEMHGLLFLHPGEACRAGFPSLVSHPRTNQARPCLASEVR